MIIQSPAEPDASDRSEALAGIHVIQWMKTPDDVIPIPEVYGEWFAPPLAEVPLPCGLGLPHGWAFLTGTTLRVFLRGIETWTQATQIAATAQPRGPNLAVQSYCLEVERLLILRLGDLSQFRLRLFGHSFGGAALDFLASRYSTLVDALHTYGQPRVWSVLGESPPGPVYQYFRWVVRGDIVPYIPPGIEEYPDAYLAATAIGVRSWDVQTHRVGAIVPIADGTTLRFELDPTPPAQTLLNVVSQLFAADMGFGAAHQPQAYIDALAIAPPPAPPVHQVVQHGETVSWQLFDTDTAAEAVAEAAVVQRRDGTGGEAMRVLIPQSYLFSVIRQTKEQFAVIWQGQVVATVPTKAEARIYARDWNRALRGYQKYSIGIDATAWLNALNNYLTASTTPDNGFSPVPSPGL